MSSVEMQQPNNRSKKVKARGKNLRIEPNGAACAPLVDRSKV
jgi:hypothetical protein